jgi:hypothetical protein
VVLSVAAGRASAQEEGKLSYKGAQKWTYILPNETWSTASGSIAIPHKGGDGFATAIDGMKLAVDTNGDGKTDDVVKGVAGQLVLRGVDAQGEKFEYGVRFKKEGSTWKYATSGAMQGRIGGELVTVIDQNNNGVWNEYGVDAMIVGKSDAASYLSKVVSLKNGLFNFEVSGDGRTMKAEPFAGETGTLDLRSGFKTYGKLVAAVVSSTDGYSFDLANAPKGMVVPVGSYTVSGGYCVKGSETARIAAGKMAPIQVTANAKADLAWGAPLQVEFAYTIDNGTLKVPPPPANVKYYGAAGEEYLDWKPDATSPEIIVTDAKTGGEVTKGRFGGC